MKPCLSIAVATCGRPAALERCLAAIAAQSHPPDQLIVVEQDPSPEAREVVRRSGMVVDYFEQAKLGLSASRNLALTKAREDILAVTDDDCLPDQGWAAGLLRGFEAAPMPAAVTGPILSPEGDPPDGMCSLSLRSSRESRTFANRTIPWHVGSGANFAADVRWLRRLAGWDERLGVGTAGRAAEDTDIIDRILREGGAIRYEENAIVRHEWQTREKRAATRWSYGYGTGALCGLRLADRDPFAVSMIASYSRMHLARWFQAAARWDTTEANGRLRAIISLFVGCFYGLRVAKRAGRATE